MSNGLPEVRRHAMSVGFFERNGGEILLQQAPEQSVACAATAQKQSVRSIAGGQESLQCGGGPSGDEVRGGAEQIVQRPVHLLSAAHRLGDERLAEFLAREALRRPPQEIRMFEPALEQRIDTA